MHLYMCLDIVAPVPIQDSLSHMWNIVTRYIYMCVEMTIEPHVQSTSIAEEICGQTVLQFTLHYK